MMNNRNTIERIRGELAQTNPNINGATASLGSLFLLANIQSTTSAISFNVLENVGTTYTIETRLKINDMFTVVSWGLCLIKAGSTVTATSADIAVARRYASPNRVQFNGTNEAANLMTIYNGTMSVTVDRRTIMDGYDTFRFYRVGLAQQGTGGGGTGFVLSQDDEWQTPNYAMDVLNPEVTLSGGGTPEIKVTLPTSVNLGGTNSTNFLGLVCRGIRWQNASKLNA